MRSLHGLCLDLRGGIVAGWLDARERLVDTHSLNLTWSLLAALGNDSIRSMHPNS